VQTIALTRGIPTDSIVVGAGSSSLIYLAFREWLTKGSRVLLPDPTYGEYAHILDRVIGCRTERLALSRANDFRIDVGELHSRMTQTQYDLVVLVNPNNPTGQLIPRCLLQPILAKVPLRTCLWVDEAYIDYTGNCESVEQIAAQSLNVVVCKSLSKVYALSGTRVAYLCGHSSLMRTLRALTPPWAVSLPAQVAAVTALQAQEYYSQCYQETAVLRAALVSNLKQAIPTIEVIEGAANSVLCYLPSHGPDADTACKFCRTHDVFLRDVGTTSPLLGRDVLRIAIKDVSTNRQIVSILAQAIQITQSIN
jgi:histidinol-phosphate/aromatic aminotransferase/cobyric acid decarboxylase-like protein